MIPEIPGGQPNRRYGHWLQRREHFSLFPARAGTFQPGVTAQLLIDASRSMTSGKPMLLVDGGGENFNSAVDEGCWVRTTKTSLGPDGDHVLEFTDRVLVENTQASVIVSE